MSKELECLDRIDKRNYLTEREHKEFLGVVEKALTEYEAIKNAEPTKAMECLESMYARLPQWDLSRNIDQCNIIKQALQRLETIDNSNPSEALETLKDMIIGNGVNDNINDYVDNLILPIKQALLKAQEPKHYLKWEDLEFKEESQWLKVKMGDNLYRIDWYIDGLGANVVYIYKYITNDYLVYCACIKDNSQQFFNDLHLERVEE